MVNFYIYIDKFYFLCYNLKKWWDMKKVFVLIVCVCLVCLLVSCGRKIIPNEPFDMVDGVIVEEYKEMEFTVCSYNIKGGEATTLSISKIKDNLQSVRADIAGLQEVDHLSNRTNKQDFLSIFKEQSSFANVAYFPIDLQGFGDTYGLAQISKTKLSKSHSFKLPYPYEYEKVEVEKRIVIRSLVIINGVQIAFYNTHLSYENVKMPNGKSVRETQFEYLLELLNSDPCPYKVVTGDFNVESFAEYELFENNGYNIVNNQNSKFDTYRGEDSAFRAIDNIIYSNRLELKMCDMLEDNCSDHNMLYAKFKTIK